MTEDQKLIAICLALTIVVAAAALFIGGGLV